MLAGLLILGSFVMERGVGFARAYLVRFLAVGGYLLLQIPAYKSLRKRDALIFSIKLGLLSLPLGYLTLWWFPEWRLAWLHLVLVGGLGLITVAVASRVVCGHSGRLELLNAKKGWYVIALVMMLLGVSSRMIGDFIPKILVTHYNYGALCWGIGLLVWAWRILPGVLRPDPRIRDR